MRARALFELLQLDVGAVVHFHFNDFAFAVVPDGDLGAIRRVTGREQLDFVQGISFSCP